MSEYIERDEAVKALSSARLLAKNYEDACAAVLNVPVADVKPVVHGHWECETFGIMRCSVCKEVSPKSIIGEHYTTYFCPWCGADMRGSEVEYVRTSRMQEVLDNLMERAMSPEWQEEHHRMGFMSPLFDVYDEMGVYDGSKDLPGDE